MDFLKKHYEKIVLCVVLLGLAGAVLWMKSALEKVQIQVTGSVGGPPPKTAPPKPLDLTVDQQALAQITNPPPVTLSGAHNLFNPVTWKRTANGDLLKIIQTGPDALVVTNIIPLYTIITYDHAMEGPIYVMGVQQDVDLSQPNSRGVKREYPRLNDKFSKTKLATVIGIKGAENDPSEINLEITATGDTNVWVSKDKPYQQVERYLADMRYDPDPTLSLVRKKVGDEIRLDGEPYIILEITNDAVRLKSRTTKVTEIKLTKSP